jgi:hypothetical protein
MKARMNEAIGRGRGNGSASGHDGHSGNTEKDYMMISNLPHFQRLEPMMAQVTRPDGLRRRIEELGDALDKLNARLGKPPIDRTPDRKPRS